MEVKTYETIIETLSDALEMEKWKREKADERIVELLEENALARKLIDDLQKEVGLGKL